MSGAMEDGVNPGGVRTNGTPSLRASLNHRSDQPFRHVPSLDGVRGIGIMIVMFGHFSAGFSEALGRRIFGVSLTIDLFFVLSGFLITSLLLEEWSRSGTVSMRNFYIRRGLRLLPALAVLLTAVLIVALVTDWLPLKLTLVEIAAAAFYVYPAVLVAKGDQVFLFHLWTLSIEEWFYFTWPVALAWFGLRPNRESRLRAIVVLLVGLCVACWGIRVLSSRDSPFALVFALRPDSLCYGALLAIGIRKLQLIATPSLLRIIKWVSAAGSLAWIYFDLLAVYPTDTALTVGQQHNEQWTSWNYQFGIWSCVAVITFMVLFPKLPVQRFLSQKFLVRIGVLSYGLYLWHQPLFLLAHEHLYKPHLSKLSPWVFGFGVALVAYLIAEVSFRVVERPALRLKDRFATVPQTRTV
jgi:peptidoglycan/LPS O-acetylase OafA/YrhL